MKKILIITMISLAFLLTGCGVKKSSEEEQSEVVANTAENVVKNQTFDGLKFTNTSLTYSNGLSQLITEVSNNTGADYTLDEFTITVKDAQGNVITTLPGYVGDVIKNGETRTIDSSIDQDLSNANSVEYSVKK